MQLICVIEVADNKEWYKKGGSRQGVIVVNDDNGSLLKFMLLCKGGVGRFAKNQPKAPYAKDSEEAIKHDWTPESFCKRWESLYNQVQIDAGRIPT